MRKGLLYLDEMFFAISIESYVQKLNYILLVRWVNLQFATTQLNSNGKRLTDLTFLNRPVHKLILLLEA